MRMVNKISTLNESIMFVFIPSLYRIQRGCEQCRRQCLLWKRFVRKVTKLSQAQRPSGRAVADDIYKIRNIGIMAHIDAGKTTTTERMLYYSGFTKHIGDVDDGDTVMDYMEEERERGITITSAAITFYWNKHKINLIDTPGHVDFTVEVERALRVIDGAVTILDASAGVEAQTLTVWRQADRYNVPRIVYLNKMDKIGADVNTCLASIKEKLCCQTMLLHLPIGKEKSFMGILDIINMNKLLWNTKTSVDGSNYKIVCVNQLEDSLLYDEMINARSDLIEQLADISNDVAEYVLNDTKTVDIPADILTKAIREATLSRKAVPVFCGSSLKNKCVQPLLDAVTYFLPSPRDIAHNFVEFYDNQLCALAFKITHDKQRGALTFLRLYSGILSTGSSLYNVNRGCTEKPSRLMEIYADELLDVKTASSGNIVCVSGLKMTITGDTLVDNHYSVLAAQKRYLRSNRTKTESDTEQEAAVLLAGVEIPLPVFFCSIEASSLSAQKDLDNALDCLKREDPSIQVNYDSETGQTILSGMGELHLDIIKTRLLQEYKVDAYLGPLQIAYRESITDTSQVTKTLDQTLGERRHRVTMTMSVYSDSESAEFKRAELVRTKENTWLNVRKHHLQAVNNGIKAALKHGPVLSFPVVDVVVRLHDLSVAPGTSLPMISACSAQCMLQALKEASPELLEPMMKLEISTAEDRQGNVLSDVSQRRGQILGLERRHDICIIKALVPLAELLGYSTSLRILTSGLASFSMELSHYEQMNPNEQSKAIQRGIGFGQYS